MCDDNISVEELLAHIRLYPVVYINVLFFDDDMKEQSIDVIAIRNNFSVSIYQLGGSLEGLVEKKSLFEERIAPYRVNAVYINKNKIVRR